MIEIENVVDPYCILMWTRAEWDFVLKRDMVEPTDYIIAYGPDRCGFVWTITKAEFGTSAAERQGDMMENEMTKVTYPEEVGRLIKERGFPAEVVRVLDDYYVRWNSVEDEVRFGRELHQLEAAFVTSTRQMLDDIARSIRANQTSPRVVELRGQFITVDLSKWTA